MTTGGTTLEIFEEFAGTTPRLWAMRLDFFAKNHEEALPWLRKA